MVNLLVMLLWAATGFALGALVVGTSSKLRARPRYLMAGGAAVVPLIFIVHMFVPVQSALFGPDLLFMMLGVGMVIAGWDAESELDARFVDERRRRLRLEWEQRNVNRVDNQTESSVAAAIHESAPDTLTAPSSPPD